jgi:hypothetical protein
MDSVATPSVTKPSPRSSTIENATTPGVTEGTVKKLAAALEEKAGSPRGGAGAGADVEPFGPSTETLPTYRSTPRPGSAVLSTLLVVYLFALVFIEVAAVVRIWLGTPLHEACPMYAAAKRSASFVMLAQTFLAVLAATRLNVLYNDTSVDGWRVAAWVHVLEAV